MSDRFPICSVWATVDEARACGGFPDEDIPDEDVEKLLESSSYLLYLLSGKRYPGICTDTVRPCAAPDARTSGRFGFDESWGWSSRFGFCCNRGHEPGLPCSCEEPSKVKLGAYPIRSIVEVEIDGEILDPSEYDVMNRRWLIRTADLDGTRRSWPSRQRLDLPLGDDGTWSVTFTYGQEPPQPGIDAAISYARELSKACSGSADCKLPSRVQSIARQGVSMVIGDPLLFLRGGLTGLSMVDSWLGAERHASRGRSAFVNPDQYATVSRLASDPWQS